jgi:hypothetical protein
MRGQAAAIGIVEPDPWPFDGCERREPVMDADDSHRVVRKVGWHRCMKVPPSIFLRGRDLPAAVQRGARMPGRRRQIQIEVAGGF